MVFRLAGEAIAEMHGRPLGATSLPAVWRPRSAVCSHLRARPKQRPTMAGQRPAGPGGAQSQDARLEVLFAPLAGPSGDIDRFLGLYQPLAGSFTAPLDALVITNLAGVPIEVAAPLRLAAVDGRRIA